MMHGPINISRFNGLSDSSEIVNYYNNISLGYNMLYFYFSDLQLMWLPMFAVTLCASEHDI